MLFRKAPIIPFSSAGKFRTFGPVNRNHIIIRHRALSSLPFVSLHSSFSIRSFVSCNLSTYRSIILFPKVNYLWFGAVVSLPKTFRSISIIHLFLCYGYLFCLSFESVASLHFTVQIMESQVGQEILLSDIKDYAIIPLGSLDYRRNAFINITNLIRSSSNGLG